VVGSGSGLVAGNAAGMGADSCVWGVRRRVYSKQEAMNEVEAGRDQEEEGGRTK